MPMTFDGSGTITGLAAGGLPDATITQADLAAGVAGTGPAFSAFVPNNTQSLTTATFTKIQFSSEEFDTNSNYDSATNYRFTPTVAGYYQVNLAVGFAAAASGICLITIYKNGSRFKDGSIIANANLGPLCVASALIYFNGSTDYVEGYGYQTSGGNLTVSVNTGTAGYFQASFVRAA
jgi:hypothetical protein